MFIREVKPSIIRNSRKEETIQLEMKTYEGTFVASSPSGKSKGMHEAEPFHKGGIVESMRRLEVFCKRILEKNFMIKKLADLKQLVDLIRAFEKKYGRMGRSATYALETVFLKAAAADNNKELFEFIKDSVSKKASLTIPMPVGNCIGGGKHSTFIKGKKPDFQEFLLIPQEKTFSRAVTLNIRAYEKMGHILKTWRRNDEGAWMTDKNNEEVLEILKAVAKQYNLRIGSDFASSSFFKKGYYHYKNKALIRDKVDQSDYMGRLAKKFGLFYMEDPMEETDFGGFKEVLSVVSKTRKKSLIVGDDLTTTHLKDVARAIRSHSMNAMILKPNQVESILELAEVVALCKKHRITMIFSHRSGETMDDAIADYCVGFGGDFIKCGIYGSERLIKLKRVMDIERKIRKRYEKAV